MDGQGHGPESPASRLSRVPPEPGSADEAVAMALAGLEWLAEADVASLPAATQAGALRGLEKAASVHLAARSAVLSAFTAQAGYEADGQGSPRTWLAWQTRVSGQAASVTVGWARRLSAHPLVAAALAKGWLSASWARAICDWTDRLPEEVRREAEAVLLAAAAGGLSLEDLAGLAEQIRARTARPDRDDDGFDDRRLVLRTTFRGAGHMFADLTPQCAAALRAVLDALGKHAGPGDERTYWQRDHDALEEACRRLIASGCVPDRAGQPTKIELHMTLRELLARLGEQDSSDGGESAGGSWPGPVAPPGAECDATITPVVTGTVDHDLLSKLAAGLNGHGEPDVPPPWWATGHVTPQPGEPGPCPDHLAGEAADCAGCHQARMAWLGWSAARQLTLARAVELLSGPGGLASWLRTRTLPPPAASVSLPLDVGAASDTIPPWLRRAIIARDQHCAAPGCDQPSAACHVHHIVPRSDGGATSLANCILVCSFHHLILVHRWGWTIRLNPDGTTTMTSPDRSRTYHSHGPPAATAA